MWEVVCASCGDWGQVLGVWTNQVCLCRYNSLSILPAALGKPVRDVAAKVCGGQGRVGLRVA